MQVQIRFLFLRGNFRYELGCLGRAIILGKPPSPPLPLLIFCYFLVHLCVFASQTTASVIITVCHAFHAYVCIVPCTGSGPQLHCNGDVFNC